VPLSSVQAAIAALVVGIGNAVVALEIIGTDQATKLETTIVGIIAGIFVLANGVIHHGVTTAAPGEDASLPKTKNG
jgi:uncharacterized membrane protein YjjP (DUF1212 family)